MRTLVYIAVVLLIVAEALIVALLLLAFAAGVADVLWLGGPAPND